MVRRTSSKRRSFDYRKVKLGERMFFRGIVFHGVLPERDWREFLLSLSHAMGMTPVASAACWNYPLGDAGGNGMTLVQPITESFLALDTWPDHRGAYLLVCSCKQYSPETISKIAKQFGLVEGQSFGAPKMLELV